MTNTLSQTRSEVMQYTYTTASLAQDASETFTIPSSGGFGYIRAIAKGAAGVIQMTIDCLVIEDGVMYMTIVADHPTTPNQYSTYAGDLKNAGSVRVKLTNKHTVAQTITIECCLFPA